MAAPVSVAFECGSNSTVNRPPGGFTIHLAGSGFLL